MPVPRAMSNAVTPEQMRTAMEEVLESETFARSDQLRSFLRYACEMTLGGRGREINEYLIGIEALGRPADFDPAADSSVRSRAYELRQKLQKYYETEGSHSPVRIELPKGAYTPRFALWHADASHGEGAAEALSARPAAGARRTLRIVLATLAVAAVVFAALLLFVFPAGHKPGGVDAIVLEAWGPLARSDANVLICVGTTLHLVVRPYMPIVAEGLPKYPAPPELYPLFRQHRPLPPDTPLDMHPVDNSVQMGHMAAVVTAATTLRALGAPYQILPERAAPITAFRGRNVILIGDPQNSDAALQKLEKAPLTLDYDASLKEMVVRDRSKPLPEGRLLVPQRGEDKRYSETYGLITVMPTQDSDDPHRTVILSGITSVGAHGAADFFASPHGLQQLKDRFRLEGLPAFPKAYQVVVRCRSKDTLLLSADYETHRVIER